MTVTIDGTLGITSPGGDTNVSTTSSGASTAARIIPTGSTVPTNGMYLPATNAVGIATNSTNAIYVNSSQSVGLGTASPAQRLDIGSAGSMVLSGATTQDQFIRIGAARTSNGYSYLDLQGDTTYSAGLRMIRTNGGANSSSNIEHSGTGALQFITQQLAPITFYTNASEKMRLDSYGRLCLGTTASFTNNSQFTMAFDKNAVNGLVIQQTANDAGGGQPILFKNVAGGDIGSITSSGTNVSYNTSSDYRLKNNIQPITNALNTVKLLKPCTYQWKLDGSSGQGFIAHELQAVVPDCVTGEKDAVHSDGSIKAQSIDTSKLIATLTAAIQELNAKVDAQAAEIAALKAGA